MALTTLRSSKPDSITAAQRAAEAAPPARTGQAAYYRQESATGEATQLDAYEMNEFLANLRAVMAAGNQADNDANYNSDENLLRAINNIIAANRGETPAPITINQISQLATLTQANQPATTLQEGTRWIKTSGSGNNERPLPEEYVLVGGSWKQIRGTVAIWTGNSRADNATLNLTGSHRISDFTTVNVTHSTGHGNLTYPFSTSIAVPILKTKGYWPIEDGGGNNNFFLRFVNETTLRITDIGSHHLITDIYGVY